MSRGEKQKALESLERFRSSFPTDARAYRNLGDLYLQLNNPQTALEYYQKQAEYGVGRDKAEGYNNFGVVYGGYHKDHVAARRYFSIAISEDSTFAMAYDNLAFASLALGDTTASIVAWQKYLMLEPSGANADDRRKRLNNLPH